MPSCQYMDSLCQERRCLYWDRGGNQPRRFCSADFVQRLAVILRGSNVPTLSPMVTPQVVLCLRCHQWRQSWHYDKLRFSVMHKPPGHGCVYRSNLPLPPIHENSGKHTTCATVSWPNIVQKEKAKGWYFRLHYAEMVMCAHIHNTIIRLNLWWCVVWRKYCHVDCECHLMLKSQTVCDSFYSKGRLSDGPRSDGNNFRTTDPLWGESFGHRWFPQQRASDLQLWFHFCWSKHAVEQPNESQVILHAVTLMWHHGNSFVWMF